MLDLANAQPGHRVLDIATGIGSPNFRLHGVSVPRARTAPDIRWTFRRTLPPCAATELEGS